MSVGAKRTLLIVVVLLAAMPLPARADGRAELVACQAMVERAAQAKQAGAAVAPPDARLPSATPTQCSSAPTLSLIQ